MQGGKWAPTVPGALLVRFSDFLPHSGLALDIACGNARNNLSLAREGLAAGREAAVRANLKASFVRADLTRFTLPVDVFSVVTCFKYRNPELYPFIRAALRPGGVLIYETYTWEQALSGLKPRNPEHLLERSELYHAFCDWEIIFYREVWMGRADASLVARKPLAAG